MKKIVAIVVIIIIVLLGWLMYAAFKPASSTTPVAVQTATSTTASQFETIYGVRVKIGPPFSIPPVATGTSEIGAGQSWGTYTDPVNHFSLDYPSGIMNAYITPTDIQNIKSYLPINPQASIVATLPPSQYPTGITVHDVAVIADAMTAPDFATCITQTEAASEGGATTTIPTEIAITPPTASPTSVPVYFYQLPNDYGGCWAGGCPFGTLFVTYQPSTNACYQFSLQAAVTDPGAVATSQTGAEQMDASNQVFESRLTTLFYQILSTITFQ